MNCGSGVSFTPVGLIVPRVVAEILERFLLSLRGEISVDRLARDPRVLAARVGDELATDDKGEDLLTVLPDEATSFGQCYPRLER
jgi:hypothetical protein